jgi:hypothetical protein
MSTIIIITPKPPTKPPAQEQRAAHEEVEYQLHVVGGDLTDQQKRQILRALLKELREE